MNNNELEITVTKKLRELGVPAHLSGYGYVRQAIILAIDDKEALKYVTKELYPRIAKLNNTTSSRVERAIRHTIETTCLRGNTNAINEAFQHTINPNKGKPTNSEFIALLADDISLLLKQRQSVTDA